MEDGGCADGTVSHLAHVLIVTSCVFLRQEELPPHPVTLGPVQHSPVRLLQAEQRPATPRGRHRREEGEQRQQPEEGIHGSAVSD